MPRAKNSLGEDYGSDEAVSEGVIGLSDTVREEAALAVDPPRAHARRVPAHLVQHHSDAIDLVRLGIRTGFKRPKSASEARKDFLPLYKPIC